nr:zinc finger, CCHC-type [Tanacetum cinerariifolium]GEZ44470.1 zinc finger, CCHC-type [Tanacetum cinerariifolium]
MGAVSAKSENLAIDEKESIPSESDFCIEAGSVGNVARFINHSYDPNLFVQCVVSSHHDLRLARIILVASDNIPPNQELTYDYGEELFMCVKIDAGSRSMSHRMMDLIFTWEMSQQPGGWAWLCRFYVIEPSDSVSINSIIESNDAIFNENRFSSVPRPNIKIPTKTEDIGGSVVPEEVTKEVVHQPKPELRKSKRNKTPKDFRPKFHIYLFEGTREEVDETIEEFKARLVIQGFKQNLGINYFDTYAPVARISTIRSLIAMASIYNLIIHQMDVKTTFLNDDLDGEVELTKELLSSKFSIKDIEEANVILDIRIKHESNRIAISQSHYIEKVVSQLEYYRVTGCLMYAMICIRHDIAFYVGKLSRYTSNTGTQHWQAIQRISNNEDISSTSGWEFLLGGAAGKEAEWLKNLFLKISLWSKPIAPISIHCDSALHWQRLISRCTMRSLDTYVS